MNRLTELKDIEHRVRACMAYHDWMERNRGIACLTCDSTEELQVHHIVELYHILLGLWKLYGGDSDLIVLHAQAAHVDDLCEAITLCKKCHDKLHPRRRIIISSKDIRIENWCVMPRHLPGPFLHHSTKAHESGLTLISAQVLSGLGWFILNGYLDARIIEFKRSAMARLLGKQPGSSFNKSLARAFAGLEDLGVLLAWHINGPEVEVHITKEYLEQVYTLPWFMGMSDVQTNKMPSFALRWFLNLQSGKYNYKIGKDKLVANLNLKTSTPAFVNRCITNACDDTEWASSSYDGEFFLFKMRRRGATPIWSLRSLVRDAIQEGNL